MKKRIELSNDLLKILRKRKVFDEDGYEDVIWDLVEKDMELSEETKKDIEEALEEESRGEKGTSLEELKRELKF